jgi:ubiquinone/menaquinone biosynthesis C-methylase UbiE
MPNYQKLYNEAVRRRLDRKNQYLNRDAAAAYDSSQDIWDDGLERAARFPVNADDMILDIGSGPGILALPLAQRVRMVTAVEPSAWMTRFLAAHQKERRLSNIRIINKKLEDTDETEMGQPDVSIMSYSLFMEDLKGAFSLINRITKRKVYLYWFCGLCSWEKILMDVYPAVYSRQYHPMPKSDLVYGILSDMGISADIKTLTHTAFDRVYAHLDQAITNMRFRLGMDLSDKSHDALFRSYIEAHYLRRDDSYVYKDHTRYVEISWDIPQK